MAKQYIENDPRGNCVCGHNHIHYVEDLGENWDGGKDKDGKGFDLIPDCCFCDCGEDPGHPRFKRQLKKKEGNN